MTDKNSVNPEYNYHFDREEYEKSRFTEPRKYKGGPFKNNKTLLITLLDISVIVLIMMVVIPFIRKSNEIQNLNGYSLVLTQYHSGNNIYLNLSIKNKAKGESDGANLTKIEFSLSHNNKINYINDLLPLPGETLSYRTKFLDDNSDIGSAKVTIGNKTKDLNIKLITD